MKSKFFIVISVLIICMFAFTGCNNTSKAKNEKIIAEVNGKSLNQIQLDERIAVIKNAVEEQQGIKLDVEKDQLILQQINESGYQNLVIMALIEDYAAKNNIVVDSKTVESSLKTLKDKRNLEDQNGFKNYLKNINMTEKQLKEELRKEKLVELVYNRNAANLTVTNEEITQYYNENIDYYSEPAGMQISHILVESEDKAKDILDRIKKGDDFKALAQEFSTCTSKNQGGDLGVANRDTNFVTEFKKAALDLKAGQITAKPVKTEFGYHIIKAGSKVDAKIFPLEQVENSIKAKLLEQKKDNMFSKFLDDLNSTADIKDLRV